MKNKFFGVLLSGMMILAVGAMHSCKTDLSDIDSKIKAITGRLAEIQTELDQAIKVGRTVTKYEETDTHHVFTMSSGDPISIPKAPKGTDPGNPGSSVTVDTTSKPGFVIITIDGKAYTLAMGSAVNSLVFFDEYGDGMVILENYVAPVAADPGNPGATPPVPPVPAVPESGGAIVKLLATPGVSGDALKNAKFEVIDIQTIKDRTPAGTRIGNDGVVVIKGQPSLDKDGYINVRLRGLAVTAGQKLTAAIVMTVNGTSISSNYFKIEVAADFAFAPEVLDATLLFKDEYTPTAVAEDAGAMRITVPGLELIPGGAIDNLKKLFKDGVTLPKGAEFVIANKQPNGKATEKRALLVKSLKADGSWAFAERPGTSFNEEAVKGFRYNVVLNDQIIAKTYLVINDPIRDLDFSFGLSGDFEAEYGARYKGVSPGGDKPRREMNIGESFLSWGTDHNAKTADWEILHGGEKPTRGEQFMAKWPTYEVKLDGENLIFVGDGEMQMSELGEKWAPAATCEGIYWYYRGLCIRFPEWDDRLPALPIYDGANGRKYGRGEGAQDDTLYDKWIGSPESLSGVYTSPAFEQFGFTVTKKGDLMVDERYTGFTMRLALGIQYEYFYGSKRITAKAGDDKIGLFFWNRRWYDENAGVKVPKIAKDDLKK